MTSLFQQAGVLGIDIVDKTLVTTEEVFDLPVLGVWDFIISMGESTCPCEQ